MNDEIKQIIGINVSYLSNKRKGLQKTKRKPTASISCLSLRAPFFVKSLISSIENRKELEKIKQSICQRFIYLWDFKGLATAINSNLLPKGIFLDLLVVTQKEFMLWMV